MAHRQFGDPDRAAVAHAAAAITTQLDDRVGDVARATQETLIREIPELRDDAQLLQLLHDTVVANIDTVFAAIRNDITLDHIEPPTTALEYARRLAQRDVSADALVRAYRIGHQTVLNVVMAEIRNYGLESGVMLDVIEWITAITFSYIDWISQRVIGAYQDERDRWQASRTSLRASRIRELLEAEHTDADIDVLTSAISYPLRRTHLALILWCNDQRGGGELAVIERFVQRLADSGEAGVEAPLFVAADRLTGWAWIPILADAKATVLQRIREIAEADSGAPFLSVGQPLPGLEGFRRSHQQAREARIVALAAARPDVRIIKASECGVLLAGLLAEKGEAVRAWVQEVLGPLASDTAGDERLRETLRAFLRAESGYKSAAEHLHMHPNTVRYRVRRALERRGREISDDRLDVEVALLLCQWLRGEVVG
ncbi:helix-turn-helix domain-containing protein [Hoyosella sp. YIM 151337]|uniref:PucR family transcriptional regulator n=1 Tax=Hoyosella sp. YIM 151337 TaxID=2992742 RepID=UPI002236B701|nr:helix-turn-helix domain-containing protein [Hoyosella sp. YIM 151337]MCW4355922.1 helix-turn-helix domain-containing protein [Hoyosella sp. YIM 151337]